MFEASVNDAVMRKLYRAHAALFVCAYAGFIGYFAVTDPDNPVAVLFNARPDPRSFEVAVPQPNVSRDIPAEAPVTADARVPVAPEARPTAEDDARQREYARLQQVRLQATRAEEPRERAQAIDQLTVATPETLQALQAVITSDSAVRNRIRALNSLRALAERDGAKDAVISIVHLAMVDTNASVASRASEVYRELTQHQPEGTGE